MKNKLIYFTIIFCIVLTNCMIASAHSGGTDASGGHYNRSTGEYHYHHGYPAHSHPNNICPYNFDDQTNYQSSSEDKEDKNESSSAQSSEFSENSKSNSANDTNTYTPKSTNGWIMLSFWERVGRIFLYLFLALLSICLIFPPLAGFLHYLLNRFGISYHKDTFTRSLFFIILIIGLFITGLVFYHTNFA